eukprot:snap_masked-scaffold_13-processed-gene-2.24-mRNA-1 protein AED:1.00 eAED:1.00 QI:0/0/0/0/1/1/2/0/131
MIFGFVPVVQVLGFWGKDVVSVILKLQQDHLHSGLSILPSIFFVVYISCIENNGPVRMFQWLCWIALEKSEFHMTKQMVESFLDVFTFQIPEFATILYSGDHKRSYYILLISSRLEYYTMCFDLEKFIGDS